MAIVAVRSIHGHDVEALGESMLEEIRRTATHRLRQIEPLIEEAHRLRDVLEVIEGRSRGDSRTAGGGGAHGGEAKSTNGEIGGGKGGGGERAAKGANKRIILDLVAAQPGITAAEISDLTGVKRTVVASTVSRLKRHGELRDHAQGGVCLTEQRAAG